MIGNPFLFKRTSLLLKLVAGILFSIVFISKANSSPIDLYAYTIDTNDDLYRVNLTKGTEEKLLELPNEKFILMTFTGQNTIYAAAKGKSIFNRKLIKIDLNTNSFEMISEHTEVPNNARGIGLAQSTSGQLYMFTESIEFGQGIYEVDKENGELTQVFNGLVGFGRLVMYDDENLLSIFERGTDKPRLGHYSFDGTYHGYTELSNPDNVVFETWDRPDKWGGLAIAPNMNMVGISQTSGFYSVDQSNNKVNMLMATTNSYQAITFSPDADNDGLSNKEEVEAGLDPLNSDSDNDGLPDSFELSNGLDPLNANDASLDSDNDGLSNLDEYLAGTDMFAFDSDLDGIADGYDDAPLVKADVVRVDINQNGAIDIPRIGTVTEGTYNGKQAVIFFDSKSGAQTSRIYMPGWFTGVSVKITRDINGNGVNEIVVLGNTSDGKKAWVVFDSAQKKVLSSVAFPAWFQPTEFDVVPDYNGNNKDEILVLGQTSDGKKVWMMHDVAWRAEISRLVFPGWYSPASYSLVKDTNGNGFPELLSGGVASDSKATWMLHDLHTTQQLRAQKQAAGLSMLDAERLSDISGNSSDDAVLLGKNANNKYFIRVQDANTGSMVDTLNYPGWFAALDVAVQKDINSSGFNDVVTLGRTSDGKKAWLTHDSYHHNQLVARVFPAWYQPTAIEVIPDINGDGAQDILVEGETSDGKVVLMVQHGKTGRDIRVIVMPSWFATN